MEVAVAVKPERFGRYVLLDRIGEGGMAEVYRAILPGPEGFKRTFVIKKILPRFNQSTRFVEMFVHEARIVALLSHPNIVQVSDFGSVDGQYYLAMEYLRGHDVLEIIRRLRDMKRTFPIPVAAFIAHAVASSLAYAHTLVDADGRPLGIVHRDVSPSNVMCLREGGVKLLDFGIASAASESGVESTDQGTFKGKLRYIAPERLRNEPFDGRADIYGLGVMLWEMLACRRLFRGTNDAEIWKLILEMEIPRPSAVRAEVPASLDAIVMRMLDRDPEKRFAVGPLLADELEEVVREAKYRSRSLPRLLVDLFGSGKHSSQLAMSAVSPELLENMSKEASEAGGPASPPSIAIDEPRPRRRSWWLWGSLMVVAELVALALVFGLPLGKKKPLSHHPPAITKPIPIPIPVPAAPASTAPAPTEPGGDAPVSAAPAAPETGPSKPAKPKKARVRGRAGDNAIAGGRSIDPFAEAARRGQR